MTLRARLALSFSGLLAVTTVTAGLVLSSRLDSTVRTWSERRATGIALVLSGAVSPALEFDDATVANRLLAGLVTAPGASYGLILREDGTQLGVWNPRNVPKLTKERPAKLQVRQDGERMDILAPVEAAAGSRGTLVVGFLLSDMEAEKRANLGWAGIVMGALCLVGVVLSLVLGTLLTRPIVALTRLTGEMVRRRDLSKQIEVKAAGEVTHLADSFKGLTVALRGTIADFRNASETLEEEAEAIHATAARQMEIAVEQSTSVAAASATVSEIAQTSRQAAAFADSVIQTAQRSVDLSQQGRRLVTDVVGGMMSLGGDVQNIANAMAVLSDRVMQIDEIIATVGDIAEQSNLLALNAAIEAARSHEHGVGFGSIAREMRALAEQSKRATVRVRVILGELQNGTTTAVQAIEKGSERAEVGVQAAQKAGEAIEGLAEAIRDSAGAAHQITTSTREQSTGIELIVEAIQQLSHSIDQGTASSKTIESTASSLATLSKRLLDLVSPYKV